MKSYALAALAVLSMNQAVQAATTVMEFHGEVTTTQAYFDNWDPAMFPDLTDEERTNVRAALSPLPVGQAVNLSLSLTSDETKPPVTFDGLNQYDELNYTLRVSVPGTGLDYAFEGVPNDGLIRVYPDGLLDLQFSGSHQNGREPVAPLQGSKYMLFADFLASGTGPITETDLHQVLRQYTFSDLLVKDARIYVSNEKCHGDYGPANLCGYVELNLTSITAAVPEPATLPLMGLGLGLVAWGVTRQGHKRQAPAA